MGSESLSRGVDLFLAQEFCFFKQEHGPTSGSEQSKTDVLLTTVLSPLRRHRRRRAVVVCARCCLTRLSALCSIAGMASCLLFRR